MMPLGENYREYRTRDRARWGSGAWDDEPDKAQWIDAATGLDCLLVRNHHGVWCGYVGVPPGHALHGVTYQGDTFDDLSVHGGVTFTGPCAEDGDERDAICHVPAPGRADHVWWIGFDTAHAYDHIPGLEVSYLPIAWLQRQQYRDWAYVVDEVRGLAAQVAAGGPCLASVEAL